MLINCIAVDDDPSALENLEAYIEKIPTLRLVKRYTNPLEALAEISTMENTDIIFLDIEMPELSGVELATRLREKTKHLIFSTAHARYALDAFQVNADAYLLKPYSFLHFSDTIQKLFPNSSINPQLPSENFFYIPLQDEADSMVKIDYQDLVALEKVNEDFYFRTIKENYIGLKFSFSKILNQLRNHPTFIQVSSSTVVSKLHIKTVLGKQVVLSGGRSVSLASKYKASFLDFVQQNIHENPVTG